MEGGVVAIDGHDVTSAIRTPEVDKIASTVARLPQVRDVLVTRQRAMGAHGGVVMEGRDIGSVVFPDADVKIYLDASAEERARRRAHDTAHAGSQAGQAAVAEAIQARDLSDKTRAASPLALAPGAEHIDTTDMPIDASREPRLDTGAGQDGPPELRHRSDIIHVCGNLSFSSAQRPKSPPVSSSRLGARVTSALPSSPVRGVPSSTLCVRRDR